MALTHVLTPIRINGVELRNRVVRTAHATNLGGGIVSETLIAYHLERARGGVGLSFLEILSVHPSTPLALNIFQPGIEDSYRSLVDQIAPTGMRMFQQLWHGGHNATPLDGGPPWSASDVPGLLHPVVPIAMTKAMIDDVVGAFGEAARKCQSWGIDGVEVHAAHGYLIQQFLSPVTNRREDEYGGPFENRLRFLREVMTAVRQAVSPDYPVGVRIAPDMVAGGVGVEDNARLVGMLEESRLVDFVDISMGNYQSFPKMIGGMHEPLGYELPTSRPIAAASLVPRIVTGRFRTLEEADQVIRDGDADLVSMVRANIADPDLVAKTMAGHPEQVRPCIACNQGCLGNVLQPPFRMECAVNPGTGYEQSRGDQMLVRAASARRVLVVGGGPAGLEAARVAALRGHSVCLMEAQPVLGGSLNIAARAPTRHGLRDFTIWLELEIYRLGVEVRLSSYAELDELRQGEWGAIIIATGSVARLDGVLLSHPGEAVRAMEQPHVISSETLLTDTGRVLGSSAVVIDDVGHYEAIAAAEYLISKGLAVTFLTRLASLGPLVQTTMMVEPALGRMQRGDFVLHTHTRAVEIGRDHVLFASTCGDHQRIEEAPADTVVFVSYNRPERSLYDALAGSGQDVRVVGDANTPRFLQAAVREGHLAGAAI